MEQVLLHHPILWDMRKGDKAICRMWLFYEGLGLAGPENDLKIELTDCVGVHLLPKSVINRIAQEMGHWKTEVKEYYESIAHDVADHISYLESSLERCPKYMAFMRNAIEHSKMRKDLQVGEEQIEVVMEELFELCIEAVVRWLEVTRGVEYAREVKWLQCV
ncbi:unnamed protein product [Linum tenue]|nr:unnamed protein product [Linum tenue]